MKKFILIIMFLLLCPSLILAKEEKEEKEEQGRIGDETMIRRDDHYTSLDIASDMFFNDTLEKHGYALKVWAFLKASGYEGLADEVFNEVMQKIGYNTAINDFDIFYKHNKKYKYSASDVDMSLMCLSALSDFISIYSIGMAESLNLIFVANKDLAKAYKVAALQMYEKYLENKKKAKDKDK